MYNIDKVKQYRLAPRLTDEHIYPNNFKKMKVKLASQIFSHSVAVAMQTYIDFEKLPAEAKTTANFIEDMNKLFDLLNSSNFDKSCAFFGNDKQIEFLNKMLNLFSNLEVLNKNGKNVTNTLKFIYGWRLTISSILKLWELLRNKGYKFLLTRHLNQDCLENVFGQVSNACGNARVFKKLFTLKCFDPTEGGNTLEDASDILLAITPNLIQKGTFLQKKKVNFSPILRVQTNDYRNLATEEGNALVYVAGYFLKKCILKHSCDICLKFCDTSLSDSSTRFCELKAYDGKQSLFGSQTVPPKIFLDYLKTLKGIFILMFNGLAVERGVGTKLKQKFSTVDFSHPCPNFPQDYFMSLYTRVRIYYTLKFANREMKCKPTNKANQKLKILQNL